MKRLLFLFVLLAAPASAAERRYSIGSFDRIRIEGPFDVRLSVAQSPGAIATGESRGVDAIDLRVEGATLIVRASANHWAEQPNATEGGLPVVSVTTPSLRTATLIGGGRLAIDGPVRGQRIDLQLTGSGTMEVAGVDADQLSATLLGSGGMRLAGRAARVRLLTSGAGRIDAAPLDASDLTVRLDGPGDTRARARYTASVTTTGIGGVTVLGSPACTVHAQNGGLVTCGTKAAP